MRIVGLVLLALLLGFGLGAVSTWQQFSSIHEDFDPEIPIQTENLPATVPVVAETPKRPSGARVEVIGGSTHDFGEMENGGKRSFKFVLKNIGIAPLQLENGGTSCAACTISNIAQNELAVGETTEVLVEWTANTPENEFRKEAFVRTNDPQNAVVRLVVQGQVKRSLVIEPSEFLVGRIPQSGETNLVAQIFSFRSGKISLTGQELLKRENASAFEVQIEPLPADEIAKRAGAKEGWNLALRIKPGLPLGVMSQTIRLTTSLPDVPALEIPIHGTVTGDISIVDKRYREEQGLVSLGVVEKSKGGSFTLHLVVKGPHRNDVQIATDSVDPAEILKVSVGEGKAIGEGSARIFPLQIEIPPNSPASSRLGGLDPKEYGKIILRTTHPTAKEIKLLVRFAVEG